MADKYGPGRPILVSKSGPAGPILATKSGPPDHFCHDSTSSFVMKVRSRQGVEKLVGEKRADYEALYMHVLRYEC